MGMTFFIITQCQHTLPYVCGREMAFRKGLKTFVIFILLVITNLKSSGTIIYPIIDKIN